MATQDVMKEWDIDGDGTVALHELTEAPVREFARSQLNYSCFLVCQARQSRVQKKQGVGRPPGIGFS